MPGTNCRLPCRTSSARPRSSRFPLAEILQQLGFAEREGDAGTDAVASRHLLPFLEAYFDKSNSEINQKLRRRLHWLAD